MSTDDLWATRIESLESLQQSWKNVGLSVFQASALVSDTEILKQNQDKANATKKKLMEQTKVVAGMEAGEQKNAERSKLERGYQQFISELTKFFKHAGGAFEKCADLVRKMEDPTPTLETFVRNKNQILQSLVAEKKLRRELNDREDELRELQDQEILIRELKDEIEDLQQIIEEHEELLEQQENENNNGGSGSGAGGTGSGSGNEKSGDGDAPTVAASLTENALSAAAELRRQIQQQDYELQTLRTECRKYQVKSDTLGTEVETLRAQLEQEIVRRDEESSVSSREAQELLVRVALAEHQMKHHSEQLAAVKEELQVSESQHEAALTENTALTVERNSLQQKNGDLQHQLQAQQTQMGAMLINKADSGSAVSGDGGRAAADTSSSSSSTEESLAAARSELTTMGQRMTLLRDQLETVTREKDSFEKECGRLTQRLALLEESEDKLQRQTLELQKEITSLERGASGLPKQTSASSLTNISTTITDNNNTQNSPQNITSSFNLADVMNRTSSGSKITTTNTTTTSEHPGGEVEQPEYNKHPNDMPGEVATIIAQRNRYKDRVDAIQRASEHEVSRLERELSLLRQQLQQQQHQSAVAVAGATTTAVNMSHMNMAASEYTAAGGGQHFQQQQPHNQRSGRAHHLGAKGVGGGGLAVGLDRLALGIFRFVANNKTARFVLSGYLVGLHIWVFIIFSWMAARSAYADGRVEASKKRMGLYYSVKNDDY